jgi:hypothetical protein
LISQGIYEAGTPEQKITEPINGWFVKIWGGGMQKSGIPDIIINVNGFFVSAELKVEPNKPTELQKKNTSMINKSNGVGIVLYPDGFENFKNIIRGLIDCKCHIPVLNASTDVHGSSKCVIWKG